jgi:hypothetical protein
MRPELALLILFPTTNCASALPDPGAGLRQQMLGDAAVPQLVCNLTNDRMLRSRAKSIALTEETLP